MSSAPHRLLASDWVIQTIQEFYKHVPEVLLVIEERKEGLAFFLPADLDERSPVTRTQCVHHFGVLMTALRGAGIGAWMEGKYEKGYDVRPR